MTATDATDARRTIDASQLPTSATGARTTLWWGVVLMVTIESTMFVLALASYFYIRGNYNLWPPLPPGGAATRWAVIGTVSLVASVVPMALTSRAAVARRLGPARAWLGVTTVLGVVFLAARWREFATLPFRWDSHAYGSIVWTTLGLHTFHGITSVLENLLLLALLFRGPVEEDHFVDLESNALYWNFVVITAALFTGVFYFEWLVLRP